MRNYKATWSTSLLVMSLLGTAVCVGSALAVILGSRGLSAWAGVLPLALVAGTALFTIRGYTVTAEAIAVRRLCWATQLPLAGLQSARCEPDAMRGSLRTFGNGGLFSFTGLYRNEKLGSYRAFVTDPAKVVVLRFADRTVVVSPASPEEFVREIRTLGGVDR